MNPDHANDNKDIPAVLCRLPLFRPVAIKLLKALSSDSSDFIEVSRLLQSDPGFSAEVLSLANSALYAGSCRVNTVLRAIMVLGSERVRALALTVALQTFVRHIPQNPRLQACWSHSRATALVAEEIAALFRIPRDQGYTAGLMHDIGRFGMLAGYTKPYLAFLDSEFENTAAHLAEEAKNFGFDHCQAGQWLAKTWCLPEEFGSVTACHHGQPCGNPPDILALATAACALATAMGFQSVTCHDAPDLAAATAMLPDGSERPDTWADDLRIRVNTRFYSLDV